MTLLKSEEVTNIPQVNYAGILSALSRERTEGTKALLQSRAIRQQQAIAEANRQAQQNQGILNAAMQAASQEQSGKNAAIAQQGAMDREVMSQQENARQFNTQVAMQQQQIARQQQIKAQLSQAYQSGDMDRYINVAMTQNPELGVKLQKGFQDIEKSRLDIYKSQQDIAKSELDLNKKHQEASGKISDAIMTAKNPNEQYQKLLPKIRREVDPNAPDQLNQDWLANHKIYSKTQEQMVKPLPPEAAGKITMMEEAQKSLGDIDTLIDKSGGLESETLWANAKTGTPFTKGRQLRALMERGIQAITRAETGAAMPMEEVENTMNRYLPSPFDNLETRQMKLQGFKDYVSGATRRMKQNRPEPQQDNKTSASAAKGGLFSDLIPQDN